MVRSLAIDKILFNFNSSIAVCFHFFWPYTGELLAMYIQRKRFFAIASSQSGNLLALSDHDTSVRVPQ